MVASLGGGFFVELGDSGASGEASGGSGGEEYAANGIDLDAWYAAQ